MAETAVQKLHNVLQMCSISALIDCRHLIDNKGFNSLEYFGFMDGDTDMLEMSKRFSSRAIATCVNFGTVQINELQTIL